MINIEPNALFVYDAVAIFDFYGPTSSAEGLHNKDGYSLKSRLTEECSRSHV